MSTKSTLIYDEPWGHLYYECLDSAYVFARGWAQTPMRLGNQDKFEDAAKRYYAIECGNLRGDCESCEGHAPIAAEIRALVETSQQGERPE